MSRMKLATLTFTSLAVLGALFLLLRHVSAPPPADLDAELQRVVSEWVLSDRSVKNCVVSVMRGDGSVAWSVVAGKAHDGDQAPMTRDTPIYIASISKLYTAAVIMLLSEKGLLSLDDQMAKYLPQELIRGLNVYAGKDYTNEITLRELLAHRSGIPDYEKARDGKSLFDVFLEDPERLWTVDETITRARRDLKPKSPPGTETSYSDTNFQLLGKVIEAVTHKPLQVVYEDLLFSSPRAAAHVAGRVRAGRRLTACSG